MGNAKWEAATAALAEQHAKAIAEVRMKLWIVVAERLSQKQHISQGSVTSSILASRQAPEPA